VNDDGVDFTDGAGLMTPSVSRSLLQKYGGLSSHQLHLAYQIRIHTAKGVLLVDPVMLKNHQFSGPHQLKLYRSMCKASRGRAGLRPGPVNGLSILDAACCILCIVKPAPSSSSDGARLSSQFVTILSHGGVPDEVFIQLQSEALRKQLAVWTEIETETYYSGQSGQQGKRLDENTRLRLVKTVLRSKGIHQMIKKKELGGMAKGLGYSRNRKADREDEVEDDDDLEESSDEEHPIRMAVKSFESLASVGTVSGKVKRIVDPWDNNEISGLPSMKSQQFIIALIAGIDVPKSNYWYKVWLDLAKTAMFSFVSKFHITVERSASGFFQPGE
jgi:RNA dependent RNA polymerase